MKTHTALLGMFALLTMGTLVGCSSSTESPDVSGVIRKNLDEAGLKEVTVSQDREKGVVTLGGHVGGDSDKAQAEAIARSNSGNQVLADEIAVVPSNNASDAKAVNADLDKAIKENLDAALIQAQLNKAVKYDVKSGVVTLTGDVNSQNKRALAESIVTKVPNVQQVVNELEVKNQKATSSY